MKKTTTINLNESVIHIDEDAYDRLAAYLDDLKIHFKEEEGADEILGDIESRIGDLFKTRLRYGIEVVTIRDVEEVIEIMGKPEQFECELDIAKDNSSDSSQTASNKSEPQGQNCAFTADTEPQQAAPTPRAKTLFRDTEKGYLGGVAAGLGWYTDIPPIWIRLFLIVLTLFYGASILIYLLFWIVVPEAKTVSQKMQMRGERINVDTIKQTVQEEKERNADNPEPTESSSTGRIILRIVFTILAILLGAVLLLFFIPALFVLLPILFVGSHLFDADLGNITQFHIAGLPGITPGSLIELLSQSFSFVVGLLLTFGIPLVALLRFMIVSISNGSCSKSVNWILAIIWFVGLVMMMISGGSIFSVFVNEFLHRGF